MTMIGTTLPTGCAEGRQAPSASRGLGRDLRRQAAPALYGSAPRFLGRFAIRDGLVPCRAVARLTARAADRLDLGDRGRIEPGKRRPRPARPGPLRRPGHTTTISTPDGVTCVWVAGQAVWRDGEVDRCPAGRRDRSPRRARTGGCFETLDELVARIPDGASVAFGRLLRLCDGSRRSLIRRGVGTWSSSPCPRPARPTC
jgi:hypothetical protein